MFNKLLKQAMKDKGLSATALSAATGIGKSSISQYLNGKNEPTDKRKTIIAAALDLPADYFQKEEVKETINETGANLPVAVAARLMGKTREFIYQGLRDGVFPWGYAVKMGVKWSYYISPVAFAKYTGLPVEGV